MSDIYEHWRELKFPPGDLNDETDDMHADLALYDAELADLVTDTPVGPSGEVPRLLAEQITTLRDRARSMATTLSGSEGDLVDTYVEYAEALLAVCKATRS